MADGTLMNDENFGLHFHLTLETLDSNAFIASVFDMATLTVRNLDPEVKQKLRLQAASHQTSMEAEARAILAASLTDSAPLSTDANFIAKRRERINSLTGIWKERYAGKSTDEIVEELRGDN